MESRGFDQTVRISEDAFGRGFLVDNVYGLLMSRDASWAVRVALNGDWGSGKTSIAKMIEERARAEGHPVGWIFPWRVNTSEHVATALTLTVLTALEEAGIDPSATDMVRKPLTQAVEFFRQFKGFHSGADFGLSVLEHATSFDAGFAEPVARKLAQQKKRLLVIIDDLDRCAPAFLPPLLLFMRSALDIPGFSFLAPFDSDVVSKTVHASNPAWSNSDRFLEKVFDFRIPIPDLTVQQKTRFLVSQLAGEQIFVGDPEVLAAANLLPGTPRAIKALARDVGLARLEIQRRDPEEISWPLLLLVTMMRATSLDFYRAYRRDVVDGLNGEVWKRRTEDSRAQEMQALWTLVGHPDEATKRRMAKLIEALEKTAMAIGLPLLHRTMHFTDEHEPMTWKEFERFIARWRAIGLSPAISELLATQSPAHVASLAITGYQRALDRIKSAAAPSATDERTSQISLGQDYLALTSQLLTLLGQEHANERFDLFTRLLVSERDSRWSLPESDPLHTSARKLLEDLCGAAQSDWLRYDECISSTLALSDRADSLREAELSQALRERMKGFARIELLKRLERRDGLNGMFEGRNLQTQLGLMAQLFIDPTDEIWQERVPAILRNADHQHVIQENARYALLEISSHVAPAGNDPVRWELMRLHMAKGPPYSIRARIARFLQNEGPLRAVWTAYTSRQSSLVTADEIQRMRRQLELLGALDSAMPVPKWLS